MILGIDLGTSNTLSATLTGDHYPVLITDMNSKARITPSLIIIEQRKALVGEFADLYLDLYPNKNLIRYYKRNFGTQKPVFFDESGNSWFSETIAAIMLRKLKFDAEMSQPELVEGCVITVPAHYNDVQRKSVLEAAKLADLPLLALIDEPVAAALYFMRGSVKNDEVLLIYDFGGGTFDLTLLTRSGNQVHVLAKDGLSNLGGKEFDEVIAQKIMEQFRICFDSEFPMDMANLNKLRKEAEEIKLGVCNSKTGYFYKWLTFSKYTFEFAIGIDEFANLSKKLVLETQKVVDRCLRSVGMPLSMIDKLVMVGGTSQIPFIKEYWLKQLNSERQSIISHDPLHSVALGAAIYAGTHSNKNGIGLPLELKSVSTYNIAIAKEDTEINDLLIHKNTPLPVIAKRVFNLNAGHGLSLKLMQYWDEAHPFTLGKIKLGPYSNSSITEAELSVENRSNGTIGLKVKNINTDQPLKFNFEKEKSEHQYVYEKQKALVDNIVINNLY
jgi:molecular chaperone DnaK (HSP70)